MSEDSNDPLSEFRNNPAVKGIGKSIFSQISQSATSDQMAGDPHFYNAHSTGDRSQERLQIRRVLGAWHSPSYRYLMDVVQDGSQGEELVLVYSFMLVKIAGRNMQSIAAAIFEGTCIFIQDYHEKEFTPPAATTPVITKIEIVVRGEEE